MDTIDFSLNDIKHLLVDPDCDPFKDKNMAITGLEYAVRQLKTKPLPDKIELNIKLPENKSSVDLENVKTALNRYCLNIVKDKEEELLYLDWQIKKNFKRGLLPFLLMIIITGSIMYNMMDERSKIFQIFLVLLNNCVIIIGWVLLWIPSEMFLYEAPKLKREIDIYKLLKDADINIHT